jgi:tetratricopeptide (TPR) repeat protein
MFITIAPKRAGNSVGSLEDYDYALKLDPKFANAYLGRAILYAYKREFDSALKDYSAAILFNKLLALAYSGRGVIYLMKEKYADADRF